MIVKTPDLRPGDLVRCLNGRDTGRHFIVIDAVGDLVSMMAATKAGEPDRRYNDGWSGNYPDHEWHVIRRSEA